MNESSAFQSYEHLEKIKKDLWSGKQYGKAAVMIGAGFSRNADPTKVNAKKFPNWKELAGAMYDELHPSTGPRGDVKQQEKKNLAISNPIKVASEYCNCFGRRMLDELLLTSIPYDSYRPGNLHETLLSLPWSDIFTTNYDTLLEDTRSIIPDRDYDIVLTPEDISGSQRPRIAKLHGSFRSNRPFIVTEEDYETYPEKFALFVNLIRQSLVENTFCLIGFSGDDPNFLSWLNWVHGNLKDHTSPMYLCGVLSLSGSESKLFEYPNVIPIDLSPIVPEDKFPDSGERNKKALEWFLNQLQLGEPPNVLNWPRMARLQSVKDGDSNSQNLTTVGMETDNFELIAPRHQVDGKVLKQLMNVWTEQRLTYPGWLVCPRKNRNLLLFYTRDWVSNILTHLDLLSYPENLLLLRELNWRLEKALVPLRGIADQLVSVVTACNPFPALVKMEESALNPPDIFKGIEGQEEIREAWLELVFALIRNAREEFYPDIFSRWMDLIKDLVQKLPKWQPRYWHEECLYYLIRLDQKRVLETLNDWPTSSDTPIWQLRRAAIMAEVGQEEKAEKLVKNALEQIRRSINPDVDDHSILSQEGWARLHASLLAIQRPFRKIGEELDSHLRRLTALSAFHCNPKEEMESMSATLDNVPPLPPPRREKKVRDGRETVTYSISSISLFALRLPGFAYLRQFEEGGLPVRWGSFGIQSGTVNASRWIDPVSPVLAMSYMVRNGKMDPVDQWLDFVKASALNDDEVHKAAGLLMNSCEQALAALGKDPQQNAHMALGIIVTAPRLLGELCFRFSATHSEQLFKLTMEIYKYSVLHGGFGLQERVEFLVKKLVEAMTQKEILARMPMLIALPISENPNFRIASPWWWNEPFNSIACRFSSGLPRESDRSEWEQAISNLIETIEQGSNSARTKAAIRLEVLDRIGGLTPEQHEAFCKALWSQTDFDSGLPSNFLFPNNRFLALPELTTGEAKRAFKQWILRQKFPRILPNADASRTADSLLNRINVDRNSIVDQILGATVDQVIGREKPNDKQLDWTAEEAAKILCRAEEWWQDNKQDLEDLSDLNDPLTGDQFRNQLSKLAPLLGKIVLPRLSKTDQVSREQALKLLIEMEQEGFFHLTCSAYDFVS